jgi:hypothetical protein
VEEGRPPKPLRRRWPTDQQELVRDADEQPLPA